MRLPKQVYTSKEHICCTCGCIIPKQSYVMFFESRQPKFDKQDNQIGIDYFKIWYHLPPEEGEYDCYELSKIK